ncbi:MAG: SAM-dependent methyltransferase [Microvirga sp.]
MTDFETSLRQAILVEGPIPVERYMGLCLRHYYGSRDPLGPSGDFTTAPEISQMFGELLGLWLAEIWAAMGQPSLVRLAELGPGRGTLMADALRAASRAAPRFRAALQVHLVETSPVLRRHQHRLLSAAGIAASWHERLEDVPGGPLLLVANEFFDALPVRSYMATERGWCERLVGLDGANPGGALVYGLRGEPDALPRKPGRNGDILEVPLDSIGIVRFLAARLVREGGAALVIDYGYWGPAFGDTLQALRRHEPVSPLSDPGEADITTHVDFHALARGAVAEGALVHGPAVQADFLRDLGIHARAEALKARATPEQAAAIGLALARLTDRGEKDMGSLFKVLALTHPHLASVPGLRARGPLPAES